MCIFAMEGTDACLILTDWPEVKEMELVKAKMLLKQPIIIDGRNIFSLEEMQARDTFITPSAVLRFGEQNLPTATFRLCQWKNWLRIWEASIYKKKKGYLFEVPVA